MEEEYDDRGWSGGPDGIDDDVSKAFQVSSCTEIFFDIYFHFFLTAGQEPRVF